MRKNFSNPRHGDQVPGALSGDDQGLREGLEPVRSGGREFCLVSVERDINSYKPRVISNDHVDWGRQNWSCGSVVAHGHVDCGSAFRIANCPTAILDVSAEVMVVTSRSGQARRGGQKRAGAVAPESVPEGVQNGGREFCSR